MGSTILVFSVTSWVIISRLWIIILISSSFILMKKQHLNIIVSFSLIFIKIMITLGAASPQLQVKYPQLWALLIGQSGTLIWCIGCGYILLYICDGAFQKFCDASQLHATCCDKVLTIWNILVLYSQIVKWFSG